MKWEIFKRQIPIKSLVVQLSFFCSVAKRDVYGWNSTHQTIESLEKKKNPQQHWG